MNKKLQKINNILELNNTISIEEKESLLKVLKEADKEFEITLFKLDRTEKVKKTTSILLEETIEELEQKRKSVEKQNRELEIEAALERVRTKAMAMNSPEDLALTIDTFFSELNKLNVRPHRCGVGIMDSVTRTVDVHATTATHESIVKKITGKLKLKGHPVLEKIYETWIEQTEYHPVLRGNEIQEYYKVMNPQVSFPDFADDEIQYGYYFHFKEGGVFAWSDKEFDENELQIFRRYTSVLSLTYRRYIDLKEAEAQAREAQIETALERVRSRSMAMHSSDEFVDASDVMVNQLKELRIDTLRIGIGIINKEDDSVEIWSKSEIKGKTKNIILGVVPAGTHPIFDNMVSAWKEKKLFFSSERIGDEVRVYYEKLSPCLSYPLPKDFNERESVTTFFFAQGSLNVISIEPLKEDDCNIMIRFAKVFGQIYQRFLDLQKAESQAKEATIEAAIERVRSQSMGMQTSKDLSNVTTAMFEQLRMFGGELYATGIVFCNKHEKHVEQWHSLPGAGMLSPFIVPVDLDHIHQYRYDQWKQGTELFSVVIPEDYIEQHFETMFKLPTVKAVFEDFEAKNIPIPATPSWEIDYGASFKHGYILVSALQPFSDTDILPRFAKVFEQTYTRFLDLQKAEAQAREAQIEAALERVRSRTMGMQKSEELKEVIQVVYDQFVHLNINIEHTGFIIDYKASDDMHIWLADKHEVPSEVTFPYFDSPHWNSFNKAKEEGIDFFANHLTFEVKNKFYKDLFKFIPGVPEETLEYYFSCPGLAISTVLLENVGLYIENFSGIPYSDEENNTLMRFGKVFQQTYTRFLDLQKAEVQTRKAQLEAALERARNQSMMMQHSDEVKDLSKIFHEQLIALNIPSEFSYIWLPNEQNNDHMFWATWSETKNGKSITQSKSIVYPLDKSEPYTAACFEAWGSDLPVHVTKIHPDETKQFFDTWKDLLKGAKKLKAKNFPEGIYYAESYMKYGCFGINIRRTLGEGEQKILYRFAIEFERAYTRFLDLKKAEEQAREAQIEAALEKVRSCSLAMHKTDDLGDVVSVLFEQMQGLSIDMGFASVSIFIFEEGSRNFQQWIQLPDGVLALHVPYFEHPISSDLFDAKESSADYFSKVYTVDEKNSWVEKGFELTDYKNLPEEFKTSLLDAPGYTISITLSKNSGICIPSFVGRLPSAEDVEIMKRVGKVFEQAYIRFIDLQKAEAQAREAQIEVALEKVRSRSLAMHSTEELQDVARVVAERLQELGVVVDPQGAVICTYPPNSKDVIHWTYTPDQNRSVPYFMPYFKNAIWDEAWKSKNSGTEYFSKTFPVRVKNTFLRTIFTNDDSDYKHLPQEYKEWLLASTKYTLSFAWAENSALLIPNNDGIVPTEEQKQILIRFAKVFEQAYIRFLDLKKAETQAREAQIEASLERVRAKAMAMHKSEEVGNVSDLLFSELNKLSLDLSGCSIVLVDEDNDKMELWRARSIIVIKPFESSSLAEAMNIMKKHMPDFFPKFFNSVGKRKGYLIDELSGKRRLQFINAFAEQYNYSSSEKFKFTKNVPEKITTHYIFFKLGYLALISENKISDKNLSIARRFIEVFDFAYTRFLDIKKAEAQTREAQIELALERIRAQVTAMQESSELLDIVVTMRSEFVSLGHEAHYFWHMRYLLEKYEKAMTSGDGTRIGMVMSLPRHIHGDIKLLDDWEKSDKSTVVFAMDVETAVDYVDKMITLGDFEQVDPNAPTLDDIRHIGGLTFIMARTTHGEIGYSLPGMVTDLPAEDLAILVRFAGVFDLAYKRFEDLKSSERQNREAQIELALERVRARTMAMQKSNELAQTAAHLFSQLNELGIYPYRCNIAIVDDESKSCRIWSTTNSGNVIPTGSALPLNEYPILQEMYDGWKTQKPNHIIKLIGEERLLWSKYISKHLPFEEYKPKNIDEELVFKEPAFFSNFYFRQGFFTVHSKEELSEDQLKIIQRFAYVFEQTYTRFLDLENAEKQNKIIQVENERKSQELEEARQLQLAMLPKELPQIPNLDIAVYMKTATEVGGDYYDFHVDSKNNLTAIIGDATGHGMKAGTMVTITKSLFNTLASSKDILKTFKRISEVIKNMKFRQLSMCLQMIKINGSELSISSAAMPPAFIYRNNEKCVDEILLSGMPLGAMLNYQYKIEKRKLKGGDVILLLSDGLPELHNSKKHMYGYEKIKTELKKVGRKLPQEIVEHFEQSASQWLNGSEQDDDVTFVVIKIK